MSRIGKQAIGKSILSIFGANHKPARKPSTTLGRAAIISIIGLITPLSFGCINCDTHIAASIAIGIAKIIA